MTDASGLTKPQTVHVVDDDESVRNSLEMLLQTVGLSVKVWSSAERFLEEFDPVHAGCLVLDLRMPSMSGLEVQGILTRRGIRLPIIFITAHGDVSASVRAMKGGARDFLEKPFQPQDLLEQINQALNRNLQHREKQERQQQTRARLSLLSDRERAVLNLMVEGKPYKQIARELDIAYKTVQAHRDKIMQKMEVDALAELMQIVIEHRVWEACGCESADDPAPPRDK